MQNVSDRAVTVAVVGHYGNRNLGDEAIIEATIAGLRRHIPGAVPIAVSMDPADSARRHHVAAFPLRRTARSSATDPLSVSPLPEEAPASAAAAPAEPSRARDTGPIVIARGLRGLLRRARNGLREGLFLTRVWRFARGVDLVMVTGSNQFLDNFGGTGGYPWTLFSWTLMARLAGKPVAFVSVGAGPIDGRRSRILGRMALRLGRYVSWRDEASRLLMARTPDRRLGDVYPDLAFALRPDIGERGDRVRRVGINPMPVFDGRYWPDARADRYARYVAILTEVVVQLRDRGWEPFLFSMQPADERVMKDIMAALRETATGALVPIHAPRSTDELFDLLRTADLVVPTRFHGALLSLACGRPVVALAYHRKTRDLMESVDLGEQTVALGDIGVSAIVERVIALAAQYESVLPRLDSAVENHRARLEEQFSRIARMVAEGGGDLGHERVRVS